MPTPALKRLSLRRESLFRPKGKEKVCAKELLDSELEARFARVRASFKYKRSELEVERTDTTAFLRSPDFEYSIFVDGGPEEMSIHQEVAPRNDRSLLENPAFQSAFQDLFDQMVGEFEEIAELAPLIDKLEEKDLELDYDSRCTWAELKFKDFPGIVRIEPSGLKIQVPGGIPPKELSGLLAKLLPSLQ